MSDAIPMAEQFVEAARGWIGTPWVNGGRTKGVGVSCTGLLIMAAREIGLAVDDIPVDEARASGRDLRRHLAKYCDPLPMGGLRHGAVVLMYGARPSRGEMSLPTHVGILALPGGCNVIHVPRFISGKTGWCVETSFDSEHHGARSLWWPKMFSEVLVTDAKSAANHGVGGAAVVSGG